MSPHKKIVIVGNSAAGIGALESFRSCDRESSLTIISDENRRLYSRCLLSYFLDGSINETGLSFRSDDYLTNLGANFIFNKKVTHVDSEGQVIFCDDDSKFDYDQLLMATGGSPKIPEQIDGKIEGVFVLRTMDDAITIRKSMDNARTAFVLGGGLVGLKAASAFRKSCLDVTVVVRSKHVLSQMIDYDAAQIVMSRLQENGIRVLTQSDIERVESENNKMNGVKVVKYEDDQSNPAEMILSCDILVIAKGVKANVDCIRDTRIECNRGIVTDSEMRTNAENIFAAGDVAETYDVAMEERSINALWTCAIQQGRIAGSNMAGKSRQYDGSLGMNSINFPGVDLISFGAIKGKPDLGFESIVENRPEEGIYKKIILKEGKIKGLILVNKIDNAGVLLSVLRRKIDVVEYKDEILSDYFTYGRLLGSRGQEEMSRYLYAGMNPGRPTNG